MDEDDAETVRSLTNVVVSCLARVEVPAALWRKHRLGDVTHSEATILTQAFAFDWFGEDDDQPAFAIVPVSEDLLERAARAAAIHGLRSYDAVQLASAVTARTADPDLDRFACYDARLTAAAQVEGFTLAG